jgi:superfamily II DNA or RNA helicase
MIFDLTQRGIAIPAGKLTAQEFTRLKGRLTVKHMGFGDRLQTMQCFTIDRKSRVMYVARMRGIMELAKMGHEIAPKFPVGDPLSADVSGVKLTLKDYQVPILKYLTEKAYSDAAVALGVASCYLDLQPGKGKTYIIMKLIQHFGCKTLFVVPGKELVVQTLATLREMFPMLTIGEYWSKSKTDGDIVVMTTRSAASMDEYTFKGVDGKKQTLTAQAYFARFGFSAFDEVHTYCTKEYQEIFMRAACRYTFGCSGTSAEREDKMDEVSYMHIGTPVAGAKLMAPVIARQLADAAAAGVAPPVEFKLEAYCLKYNGPVEFTESLTSKAGTVSCAKMVSQFSKDPWRSQWLVEVIRKCVADGHQVFVLLDRTELCKLAWDYLSTAFTVAELAMTPGVRAAGIITGKTKDKERSVARKSRVIIGTYQCIGTGLSYDEFSAIVFWHPRKNKFRQFLNRIFRENGDRGRSRVAYYLQDNATSLKSQYAGYRKTCQAERNVTPTIITRDWTDIIVTAEVKKISDDFIKWDAEHQQAMRDRENGDGKKKDQSSDEESSDSDEELDEGLD